MSFFRKIFNNWKTEFDVQQKLTRFNNGLQNLASISNPTEMLRDEINFSHSGHAGDIIYSIPSMIALAEGKKINLYLTLNQPNRDFTKKMKHPNGSVMLTEKSVELIEPLILAQTEFIRCEAHQGQQIHYNLTDFRNLPFDYRMGSIARWYFLTYGISADLGKPWLKVVPDESVKDSIVLARSSRYHTLGISYRFLNKYSNIIFVGIREEFEEMKKEIPGLIFRPVKDFLEMASIIAGCKLFIGNQSFPFSLAEGLKVKRVLEVYPLIPNVVVEGEHAYDFCYQPQFEKIIKKLLV